MHSWLVLLFTRDIRSTFMSSFTINANSNVLHIHGLSYCSQEMQSTFMSSFTINANSNVLHIHGLFYCSQEMQLTFMSSFTINASSNMLHIYGLSNCSQDQRYIHVFQYLFLQVAWMYRAIILVGTAWAVVVFHFTLGEHTALYILIPPATFTLSLKEEIISLVYTGYIL